MEFPRQSGILLHPTSLPGPYGIGEIGPEAHTFVDALEEMGQQLWQILPIGPTGESHSPYQSFSTFAGNPLLISFDLLIEDGLLRKNEIKSLPHFSNNRIDFESVVVERKTVMNHVSQHFLERASDQMLNDFKKFCNQHKYWLDDYALYIVLKGINGNKIWTSWDAKLEHRYPDALQQISEKYGKNIQEIKIHQFLFHDQWKRLRQYCHRKGIKIIGDLPIYVAHDSADVWANSDLFCLDKKGNLKVQAGVPPDYFSETGQLWGNPIYRWNKHHETEYQWWIARVQKLLEMVDIIRIDHFCGFSRYWEVDIKEVNSKNGKWVEGSGEYIFNSLINKLGPLPIIAEDLGNVTTEVETLRDKYHFPGMRILQFAFSNDPKADDYRPENYPTNCVVYTGTHDNDTTDGWFNSRPGENSIRSEVEIKEENKTVLEYLKSDGKNINWDMIKLALFSRANTAIFPLQDIMGLDSRARMNVPGTNGGNNWRWRFSWDMLTPDMKNRMRELTVKSKRFDLS